MPLSDAWYSRVIGRALGVRIGEGIVLEPIANSKTMEVKFQDKPGRTAWLDTQSYGSCEIRWGQQAFVRGA